MHFASIEYAALLSVVFVAYWALGRRRIGRLCLLLAASYLFYGWWSAGYLLLIVGSSALDFMAGWRIARSEKPTARKRWLGASLAGNLGLLGLFKYFDFFARAVGAGLARLGAAVHPPQLGLALPVGISFYTFQSMSYTIDIYAGDLDPTPSALAFFVFVAFFPQLVAGPIVRARYFLPQLAVDPSLDATTGAQAFTLIGLGLIKKTIIADLLATHLVDRVFEMPQLYTSAELLVGVYGYAVQIYCDFSAYSDIAIGSALLLGLRMPPNFDRPYQAASLREFWRRWHISLSTWLRDYLYVPLGGSRGGELKTHRNLALTMLLGGLWHGAAWTFVLWGALHGLGLSLTRLWQRRGRRIEGPQWRALMTLLTFHFVCFGWLLFRSPSVEHAGEMIRGLARLSGGTANVTPLVWALLAVAAIAHWLPTRLLRDLQTSVQRLPAPAVAGLLVALVVSVRWLGATDAAPFIYFQF